MESMWKGTHIPPPTHTPRGSLVKCCPPTSLGRGTSIDAGPNGGKNGKDPQPQMSLVRCWGPLGGRGTSIEAGKWGKAGTDP